MSAQPDFDRWASALDADSHGRPGQLAALVRESSGTIPTYALERLAHRIAQTPVRKKPGRKPEPLDKYGATPTVAKKAQAYIRFWESVDAGVPPDGAAKEARSLYAMTDEGFRKLISKGDERVVAVLRRMEKLR